MIQLFEVSEEELLILSFLNTITFNRDSQEYTTVKNIMDRLDINKDILISAMLELKIRGYIEQTFKEGKEIFWNNLDATYKISDGIKEEVTEWLIFVEDETKVVIKKDYIWYAVYGSSVCFGKFVHSMKGGIFETNHADYEGCSDYSHPIASRQMTIPYRGYIGGSSPFWQYKGTMFLDYTQSGETLGRMYLIKRSQYEDIRNSLGRGNTGYNKEINLGECLGKEIKAVTTKESRIPSTPSIKYRGLVQQGLIESYGESNRDMVLDYISRVFDNEVQLNLNIDYIKKEWYQDIRNALNLSEDKRKENIEGALQKPKKIVAATSCIKSDESVVAEALLRSKNRCERCGIEAPVINGSRMIEFWEVHYKVSTGCGGHDRPENIVILCPNCEREIKLGLYL